MQAVREKINKKLSDVAEISTGIYRGVRKQAGKDFAAYTFDLNSKLPRTVGHLSVYLDEVLGQSYFSETAAADLRWNNYLYFVVGNDEAQDPSFNTIKKILEADRNYARKYVILEDDFDQVLDELDAIAVVKDAPQTTDVLQAWSKKLEFNGLNDVLDDSRTISDIVREISTGSAKNTTRTKKESGAQESRQLVLGRLESICLEKFRPYPKQTKFEKLGKANLIFGANGAGKTSFMEALEFLFCGANRRSNVSPDASVSGRLQSGLAVTTSTAQPMSDFKTRQRLWYGSDDTSRNNNLPNQFSRFNFLNTDAAAELSLLKDIAKTGQKNSSETLADLLSGHEATEVWKRIQSLQKSVISEVRDVRLARDVAKTEKDANAQKLRLLEDMPGQAAALFSIFVKSLHGIAWKSIPLDAQSVSAGFDERLVELGSRLTVVRQLGWMEKNITEKLISEKIAVFSTAISTMKKEVSEIRMCKRTADALAEKQSSAIARRKALTAIPSDVVEDLVQLTKSLNESQDELSLNAKTFSALFVYTPPQGWQNKYGNQSVKDAHEQCEALAKKTEEELLSQEKRLKDLISANTQMQNAISQVQDWARKVIDHRHSDKNCPVCNTEFQPGELLRKMSAQVSAPSELALTNLKQEINRLNRELLDTIDVKKWLSSLFKFCETIPGGTTLTILEGQARAVKVGARCHYLLGLREQSQKRLEEYARTGLVLQEVIKLCLPLDESKPSDSEALDIEAAKLHVDAHLQQLENTKLQISKKMALHTEEVNRLLAILSLDNQQSLSIAEEIAETRFEQLQRAAEACNELHFHLALDSTTNLNELCGLIETSVLNTKRLLSTKEQATKADTEKNAINRKIDDLGIQIMKYDETIARLEKAAAAIKDIVENHSLDSATATVIEATHTVADNIFSRIHTPAEYRVNATPEKPLTRRNNDVAVQLNEVSTGQRAAYALSMFLAMNAQVKDGPKVMLLDDPISHIDDLNALSFLDYLRNIVLKSDRQLFFATADEKIAGLFVHKFGFLGDDFQIIELNRG